MTELTIPSWSSIKKHYLDTGSVTMPVSKAITDYRAILAPILMKIKAGEPLTPQEERAVEDISWSEWKRISEGMRDIKDPAFDDGYSYADGVLNAGGDIADLAQERKNFVDNRFNTEMESPQEQHPYEILDSELPEAKLRDAIRGSAWYLGTDSRAHAADSSKIRGMGEAIVDHLNNDKDDDDSLDSDDYEGGE